MTKDDIIWGNEIEFESNGWESYFMPDQVRKAMDLFAKQQAIAFNKWMHNNAERNGTDAWRVRSDNYKIDHTSEQLYDNFVEQQNKEQ